MGKIKTRMINRESLPLVIEPDGAMSRSEFFELLHSDNDYFRKELLKYGALLFRNFPLENEDDFAALIQNLNLGQFLNYIGGDSPRDQVKEGIYTSTEAPPSVKIPLHNELSFVDNFPKHIYFFCQIAPEQGGETIIGDARKVLRSVAEPVKQRFFEKGLKYVSRYYHKSRLMDFVNSIQRSHKSWIDVFETDDKQEVERKCRDNNFGFKWNQNDWIEISQIRPVFAKHPKTDEEVWFNQAHLFDFSPKLLGWWRYLGAKLLYSRPHTLWHEVFFADRSEIPREDLYHIMDVLDANTVAFPWQKGDCMVLDNMLTMHGRAPFKGKRRVLAAMTG